MVKIGVAGLGKMGISHFSIVNSHPQTQVDVCDSSRTVLDVLGRYTGARVWRDYDAMLEEAGLDAVIVATPSRLHGPMVRKALERGLHVFCEKPFCLDWREAEELAAPDEQCQGENSVSAISRSFATSRNVRSPFSLGR